MHVNIINKHFFVAVCTNDMNGQISPSQQHYPPPTSPTNIITIANFYI